jgi:predicted metal-dependent phosphoesterase TrpH
VAPHPFDRFRAGIRQEVLDDLDLAAIETFNAAVTFKSFNADATTYAKRRGIAATAGSDAHHDSAAGISSTAYDLTELSLDDLLQAVPKGGTLNANYLPFREAMKKNFGNWFRIFNPKPVGKG